MIQLWTSNYAEVIFKSSTGNLRGKNVALISLLDLSAQIEAKLWSALSSYWSDECRCNLSESPFLKRSPPSCLLGRMHSLDLLCNVCYKISWQMDKNGSYLVFQDKFLRCVVYDRKKNLLTFYQIKHSAYFLKKENSYSILILIFIKQENLAENSKIAFHSQTQPSRSSWKVFA